MPGVSIHPYALAAMAASAVPDLDVVGVSTARMGTDYLFALVEDGVGRSWVVRAPVSSTAGAGQEAEIALLKALAEESFAGRLPFEIPRPAG
ncbi:MAG: aminoglycoside phosphotransferase, partial [Micrococcales bacterium]|nr:aminoglycoside phosphotransferase [Micrococcales bacterium]